MSDVLDIESQLGSEFGEETELLTTLKLSAKSKKGRGFLARIGKKSALDKKYAFDNLNCALYYDGKSYKGILPQKSVEGWTIFVTGIHEESTEEDLREVFCEYGKVIHFILNVDRRTGFIKGYAIVEYETYEEALNTIDNLNGVDYLGHVLKIEWAFVTKVKL